MSFFVFALAFAFILWRQLGKSTRPEKAVRSEAERPSALARLANDDDDDVEEAVENVAGLVSNLFGDKGRDFIEQAVGRAIQESRTEAASRRPPNEAIEQIVRAVSSARTAPRDKRRTKYLLDGDGGFRQRSDRTARLEQSFRGKGLCSPR